MADRNKRDRHSRSRIRPGFAASRDCRQNKAVHADMFITLSRALLCFVKAGDADVAICGIRTNGYCRNFARRPGHTAHHHIDPVLDWSLVGQSREQGGAGEQSALFDKSPLKSVPGISTVTK